MLRAKMTSRFRDAMTNAPARPERWLNADVCTGPDQKEAPANRGGAGRDVVGISRGAVSGQLMVSDQAARSIG
jgi:hypothetical protein